MRQATPSILPAAAFLAAGWAAGLAAQEAQTPPVFRGGVELIQLDVSVLDRGRRPVRGLGATDFTVLIDGQPRPITAFKSVELPPPPPPPSAPWMRDIAPDVVTNAGPAGRVVAIVIDDGSFGVPRVADLFAVRKARELARAAVDQLGPSDVAAVIFTENSHTSQNFTRDRQRLLTAIDKASLIPSPDVDVHKDIIALADDANDPFGVNRPGCDCGACSIEALGRIADGLRSLPQQRKIVIFISAGVRVDSQVSVPYVADGKSYVFRVEYCNVLKQRTMADVFRRASLSNVTIQAVDVRGLIATDRAARLSDLGAVDTTGGIDLRVEFLQVMAETTGGRAIVRNNDMERELPALFDESSSYYLLGVDSPVVPDDGRLHAIQVRVNRPDVEVRTRRGFYAPTAEERRTLATAAIGADEAIAGALPRAEVPLEVSVLPFADPADTGRAVLAIVLAVTQPISVPGGARDDTIEVVSSAFNPESGRGVGSERQTLGVTWDPANARTTQFEVTSRLPLAAGRYEVRLAVATGDGRSGSVYTYVDVPNFEGDDLSLSALVLGATPSPMRAAARTLTDLMPIAPTARRTFRKGDRVTAFLRAYQHGEAARSATVTTRLTDGRSDVLAEIVEPLGQVESGRARPGEHQIDLPIDDLSPGDYLLTVEVAASGKSARRDVRFRVE